MNNQSWILTALQNGLKVLAIIVFVITAAVNIYVLFSISSFIKIYKDILHGAPLPLATEIVLRCHVVLFIIAFIWPIIGIRALYMKNQTKFSTDLFILAQGVIILQCALTILVLMLPMVGGIMVSIQDASSSR